MLTNKCKKLKERASDRMSQMRSGHQRLFTYRIKNNSYTGMNDSSLHREPPFKPLTNMIPREIVNEVVKSIGDEI